MVYAVVRVRGTVNIKPDKGTLTKLLSTRGKLSGDKPLTEEHLKNATSYPTFEKLSEAILENKVKYKEIPEVKPVFRLNQPRKGHRTVKRSFVNKGSLGYRKDEINKLIERML
jgi:large subunit ribosomal protein L30